MAQIVQIVQLILSLLLIVLVLIQSKGVGLSGTFGGGGEIYHTRRGAERFVFSGTIVVFGLFMISSLLNVWLT